MGRYRLLSQLSTVSLAKTSFTLTAYWQLLSPVYVTPGFDQVVSVVYAWSPEYKTFPDHPIARGVKPFSNRDEWYFNIRFARPGENSDASRTGAAKSKPGQLTPILTATPSDEVRQGKYVYPPGPYEHIMAASGREETLMWAFERPGGGRGFGFTGGHTHANWANDNQRKVVLNALLWVAKADVPANGVESRVSAEELKEKDRKSVV